jgi:hypothetical protein
MSYSRLALLGLVTVLLAPACQQGAAPPAEPNQAPAAVSPPPVPSAAAAEPQPSAATEAPSAATASAEPVPTPSAAPASSASAEAAKPGKPAPASHAAAPAAPLAAASATPTPTDAPSADACTTKNFHYTLVSSACRTGGRKAAKEVMKGAVKKAKAAGTDLKCTSCHEDVTSFHLKSNAVSDMKPWL